MVVVWPPGSAHWPACDPRCSSLLPGSNHSTPIIWLISPPSTVSSPSSACPTMLAPLPHRYRIFTTILWKCCFSLLGRNSLGFHLEFQEENCWEMSISHFYDFANFQQQDIFWNWVVWFLEWVPRKWVAASVPVLGALKHWHLWLISPSAAAGKWSNWQNTQRWRGWWCRQRRNGCRVTSEVVGRI